MDNAGYALITAGGTAVRLDGARRISQDEDSSLAVSLAHRLLARGIAVVLIRSGLVALKHALRPEIRQVTFETYDEYVSAIRRTVKRRRWSGPMEPQRCSRRN